MFGCIENDRSVLPALGKTRKSLEEVAMIMFGSEEEGVLKGFGNAGNDAAVSFLIHGVAFESYGFSKLTRPAVLSQSLLSQ